MEKLIKELMFYFLAVGTIAVLVTFVFFGECGVNWSWGIEMMLIFSLIFALSPVFVGVTFVFICDGIMESFVKLLLAIIGIVILWLCCELLGQLQGIAIGLFFGTFVPIGIDVFVESEETRVERPFQEKEIE